MGRRVRSCYSSYSASPSPSPFPSPSCFSSLIFYFSTCVLPIFTLLPSICQAQSTNQTVQSEGEVIVPESSLALTLHAIRFTNGSIGLVGNGLVAFVILTPFIHHFFPRLYACLSCRRKRPSSHPQPQPIPMSIITPTAQSPRITITKIQHQPIPPTTVIPTQPTDAIGASPLLAPRELIMSRTTRSSQSTNISASPIQSTRIHAKTHSSQVIPHVTSQIPEEVEMMEKSRHVMSVQIEVDEVLHVKDGDGDIPVNVPRISDAKSQPPRTLSPPPTTSTHSTPTSTIGLIPHDSPFSPHSPVPTHPLTDDDDDDNIHDHKCKVIKRTTIGPANMASPRNQRQKEDRAELKQRNLSPVTFLMGMQAGVDIILIVESMVVALQHIISPGWKGGSLGLDCQSNGFALHLLSCTSISNLIFIAYERHQTIVFGRFMTLHTAIRCHLFCWIVAIVINIIPLISLSLPQHQQTWVGLYVLHPNLANCLGFGRNIHMLITAFVYIIIGMSYLLIAYTHIFFHVRSTLRATATILTHSSPTLAQRNKQHETRIGMLMFLFTAVFFACWAPAAAAFMYYQFMGDRHVDTIWDAILFTMGHASFMFNPYVYGMIDPRVRQFAKRLFCCQLHHTDDESTGSSGHDMQTESQSHPHPPIQNIKTPRTI